MTPQAQVVVGEITGGEMLILVALAAALLLFPLYPIIIEAVVVGIVRMFRGGGK